MHFADRQHSYSHHDGLLDLHLPIRCDSVIATTITGFAVAEIHAVSSAVPWQSVAVYGLFFVALDYLGLFEGNCGRRSLTLSASLSNLSKSFQKTSGRRILGSSLARRA